MIRIATFICIAAAVLFCVNFANAAEYTVTKTADTNDGVCDMADCSLREAVAAANGNAENDSITFATPLFLGPQTITLMSGELVVANNGSLTILGPGANRLTISGNNASRILVSGANVVVNISGLRFTAGNGMGATNTGRGGAIYNVGGTMLISNSILTGNSAANGGALNNAASTGVVVPGNLTIDNCIISNNSSTSSGGAMQNFSTSTLHLRKSTVNNNHSANPGTGIASAFQANGTVTITNSTFSGNTSAGTGGAIYYNGVGLTMNNVTITGNTSVNGSGGFHKSITTLNANVRNSIFSGNTGGAGTGDALGAISSQGNNIIQVVGTSTGWVMSDLQNVDPKLGPLGFHGGFGMTHYPLSTSPAIDAAQSCVLDLTCAAGNPPLAVVTDQRGAARSTLDSPLDIGAVEVRSAYSAMLPDASVGVPYNYTIVPNSGAFTYSINSGTLGGLLISGTSPTIVSGTAPFLGVYDAVVQINGAAGQALLNYRIVVASSLSIRGRVLTSTGEPVSRAYVTLQDINSPATYTTVTGSFGFFYMDGIPLGTVGDLVVANKKGLTFTPLRVTVNSALDGIVLQANPPSLSEESPSKGR